MAYYITTINILIQKEITIIFFWGSKVFLEIPLILYMLIELTHQAETKRKTERKTGVIMYILLFSFFIFCVFAFLHDAFVGFAELTQ